MRQSTRKAKRRDPNVYPRGWDYKRAAAVAAYYDARKDEDVLGDEVDRPRQVPSVWVEVPEVLLPKVRQLIARHRKSA